MSVNEKEFAAFTNDLYQLHRELPQAHHKLLEDLEKLTEEAGEHTSPIIIEAKALRLAQKFAENIGKRIEGGSTF
ncbi:hypothetical protein DesLBE_3544 [Desulfitobacterium sp. LBE]|uniref:Uncharacterized protein n=1 Tax=Desulfitobacterium chlororespirans DSM 11544 TaxID=1121395 RepID=A0A1M7TD01_9FIRM|nr:hypothetical protein DesLBE_3544 [Desulfitobacterium sp. LBE]SHN68547.1 hypothetical protein SAMN02745215_01802 [Desulfitobacterium chlororespirans DSM 11544]